MKNMFKLATGLFCLGIAATFTACGDSDSTSSKTEMVSCYGLTIFENDDGDDEYNESCLEAESGTKMAKIIKNACEMMKEYISEKDGEKSELGDGCSTKKKALYTCNATYNKEEYTSYHYQLDSEDQALTVKGDDKKSCENLSKDVQKDFKLFE